MRLICLSPLKWDRVGCFWGGADTGMEGSTRAEAESWMMLRTVGKAAGRKLLHVEWTGVASA